MSVMRRASGAARGAALVLAIGGSLAARPAGAQEWHESYHSGVAALGRGDHARAVEALQRAIALRPEPGRNVVTYGTNVEPRYFPYLALGEAYLALGRLEAARKALETSASWGREPADERQKLQARLDAATEQRRPPPSTVPPTPVPVTTTVTAAAAPPVLPEAPPPTPTVSPASPPLPSTPSPSTTRLRPPPGPAPPNPRSEPTAGAPAAPSPEAATGTLEIVSQPAGAAIYIDDESVGSSDPATGRFRKTGLPAGTHHVRVSCGSHEDAVRDIAVPPGGIAVFEAMLKPVAEAPPGGNLLAGVLGLVVIALVAVLAWVLLLRPRTATPSIWRPTPRSFGASGGAVAGTPPGHLNPGMRQDEQGQEWFGDFHLLEMLGRGGMASVYKAERRGELSALKRPLASFLDDSEFLERFLREAEIGRTLNHPNIVRILERGDVEGVPYFSMELVPGETLQAFVRRGAAAPRPAASIVAQVAEALDFAHSKGVVHRDLKPSNIMLLPDGAAKVMDFGIARARRFDGLTATGAFLGTPDYVAPEMIEGRGIDPRSDLYSLGVVLFELLTGQRPFTGDSPFAILKKHCVEEPPPPSRLRAAVPPELDAIVLRLLSKEPEGRPASAEDLVVELRDWLNRAA
jgi:hypothetical protein